MKSAPVLIVPACERGRGSGHISRSLFLLRRLEELGRQAFLWIPESLKDDVFTRFRIFFDGFDSLRTMLLFREEELAGRAWGFIVFDNFRTTAEEFAFWSAMKERSFSDLGSPGRSRIPLIGIDEGGPCRDRFDFLIDLLPSKLGFALSSHEPNLSAPRLLPLPKNRRPLASNTAGDKPGPENITRPLRVLISFGAEDSAGLGIAAARTLAARNTTAPKTGPALEITLIAPNRRKAEEAEQPAELAGVKIIGMLPGLKEHLAEYDLFVTHFGLGAFEAVYARVPVLLFSPTAYHKKLARNAGFFTVGISGFFTTNQHEPTRTLERRRGEIARRYGLEDDQKEDFSDFISRLAPRSPANCPVCEGKAGPVIARFPGETFRRCPRCGTIYLARLNAAPIEYEKDYFFGSYKRQYGKTYLEDFPNLLEAGRRRAANIKKLLDKFLRGRKMETKPQLLDIGCAYGPFLASAAEAGFAPSGIEPAEDAVRYVKEELGFPCWHGFFPAASDGAEAGSFNAVTLWYVIEHFEEPGKILAEIHRLLKDGGVLAFSTPSSSGISGRKSQRSFLKNSPSDHWTVWSPRACKKIFRQYGFRLRKIVVTGHHPERFPLVGRFVQPAKKCPLYRLLLFISRVFRLGDTFEAYGEKHRQIG